MQKKKLTIGFIGQGYIGKNYADNFESRGYGVVRYALEEPYTKNKDLVKSCDLVIIAVPTPTTPKGFDVSIVRNALSLVGKGKIAVIKSTVLPGTTTILQKKFPQITLLYSPEFLSEITAAHDVAHPFMNIAGMPQNTSRHKKASLLLNSIVPPAPETLVCTGTEAEFIKYSHNVSAVTQVLLFNLLYDLAHKKGANWSTLNKAIKADPLISNRYSNPVHKSGRGAGGHCFIKDFAAFRELYGKTLKDPLGLSLLIAMEKKNIDLLRSSKKDLDLLAGVYGPSKAYGKAGRRKY